MKQHIGLRELHIIMMDLYTGILELHAGLYLVFILSDKYQIQFHNLICVVYLKPRLYNGFNLLLQLWRNQLEKTPIAFQLINTVPITPWRIPLQYCILCTHRCVVHCKSTVFLIFLLFENLANLTYVVPKEKIREDYEPVFVDKIKLLNVSCVMYSALY